ncbi:4919_t:CDS:2 [Cetraspora pellucida]|uniref:4919_t:CDS:1 n=1 Tax=Cetraspora pellucida TaxID=1433469 RepID=A0A9N8ZB80_9GLOM|nr:4919_t:CDS:2 [Cetraspora pellucida]
MAKEIKKYTSSSQIQKPAYNLVAQKNANNVGNYVYLSNESIDTNVLTNNKVENIKTYFKNKENKKNRISIREYEDNYYEIKKINYFNE